MPSSNSARNEFLRKLSDVMYQQIKSNWGGGAGCFSDRFDNCILPINVEWVSHFSYHNTRTCYAHGWRISWLRIVRSGLTLSPEFAIIGNSN
jgi:hypothetical protein